MPRKKNSVPSYLGPHSSGQAFIRVHGRNEYLGVYDSPESRERYARRVAELAAGQTAPGKVTSAPSVAAVAARWLEEEGPRQTANELRNYRRALLPLTRLYGSIQAADFGTNELETVRQAMIDGSWLNPEERAKLEMNRQPAAWCRNVVNRQIVRIRTVWRWAEKRKHIPAGSWEHLRTVKRLGPRERSVRHTAPVGASAWEDVERVIAVLEKNRRAIGPGPYRHPVSTMLAVQWHSGMRSQEIRVLRTADVDQSGPVWIYRVRGDADKSAWREDHAPRVVALGPECQRLLGPWLRPDEPGRYVFEAGPGRCYTDSSYPQAVREAGERVGVRVRPYSGRHAAKRRAERLLGPHGARSYLGQSSLGSTQQYASQQDLETAIRVAREIG